MKRDLLISFGVGSLIALGIRSMTKIAKSEYVVGQLWAMTNPDGRFSYLMMYKGNGIWEQI